MHNILVTSSVPLDTAVKQRLEKIFTLKHKDAPVQFSYSVNPGVIGGLLVVDGDSYYDATFKSALTQIRENIFG